MSGDSSPITTPFSLNSLLEGCKMALGLIGRKLGMGQIFDDGGKIEVVTIVEAGPCHLVKIKDLDSDGYQALQLGYGEFKRPNKPLDGHFKKAGVSPKRILREFRVKDIDEFKVGQVFKVDVFNQGERVNITGISKGKGFSGVVKRWGFKGGRASRGSMFHRAPGSIGTSATPSRVLKGKKLPGRMGNRGVTIKRARIVKIDADNNILMVKGALPGPRGNLVIVKKIA